MPGLRELGEILAGLEPEMGPGEYVFCTLEEAAPRMLETLRPFAMVHEREGVTLVLEKPVAARAGLAHDGEFRRISLGVHSSLHAVGLTATVAQALAGRDISANVIAGFYHDHVFVPAERAHEAFEAIRALACTGR